MASIYDKASLVLIPSGTKTSKIFSQKPVNGDGDFTFSRSTAATRVNADGDIEKETQNLILQSNSFDTSWSNFNLTLTGSQAGYDGSNDAWKLTAVGTGGGRKVQQANTSSGVLSFSVYAKAGTANYIALECGGTGGFYEYFNLTDGTDGAGVGNIDVNAEDVGNGWWRFTIVGNPSGLSSVNIFASNTNNATDISDGQYIYIQDAQLNQGLIAQEVITTTTAAVEGGITDNVPRLDYTDSSCPALLLEPQRTNIFTQSEYFNGWAQINTITTDNSTASPEGTQNAAKLVANSGYSNKVIFQGITANTYTASVFAKKGELEGIVIATGTQGAFFNLNTQTFRADYSASVTSYKIENYGDGWYRYSITFTEAAGNNLYIGPNDNVSTSLAITGDGSSGIYIYGAQLEAGSYPTSYIPTYGTSVTRNADLGSSSYTGITSTSGTLFFDLKKGIKGKAINSGVASLGLRFSSTGTNNSIGLRDADGRLQGVVRIEASSTYLGIHLDSDTANKVCFVWTPSYVKIFQNGVLTETASVSTTRVYNTFDLPNTTRVVKAAVNQVLTFPTALSNEEAIALTTI